MIAQIYDNETVQDLLGWAKNKLETKNYPTEKFQLDKCTTIVDCKYYLESMVAVISKNWENPNFHPALDQLQQFREKFQNEIEKVK